MRPRVPTARVSLAGCRSQISRTPSHSIEGGDLAGEDAKSLLRGLLELHAIPSDEFPWDPSLGDAFNAREAELERRVGRAAAGWLSAGRPRREAFRVALRLTARAGRAGAA